MTDKNNTHFLEMIRALEAKRAERLAEGISKDSIIMKLLNGQILRMEAQHKLAQSVRFPKVGKAAE